MALQTAALVPATFTLSKKDSIFFGVSLSDHVKPDFTSSGLRCKDASWTLIDGGEFDGAKAYKDSKVCNMLTMQEFGRVVSDPSLTKSVSWNKDSASFENQLSQEARDGEKARKV